MKVKMASDDLVLPEDVTLREASWTMLERYVLQGIGMSTCVSI